MCQQQFKSKKWMRPVSASGLTEDGSESVHQVTLDPKDHARLSGGAVEPEELIRKSFEFLLEREPKESILSRFDLTVISRYFPEYERDIKRRLSPR